MSYEGRWVFHSIGTVNDDNERVFLSADEYLNSPMPYVDESDPDAVADEMKERKRTVGEQIEICEDGKLYVLMPLPEGVSQDEVDAAVAAGVIKVYDGMMTDNPLAWEERNGELWIDMGMSEDGFVNASGEDGYLTIVTTRYTKVD